MKFLKKVKTQLAKQRVVLVSLFLSMSASPAFAGLDRATTVFETVNGWLIAASISVVTMAIMWGAYRMIFKGAQWDDVQKPVIGGILFGSAGTIATLLVG